MDLRTLYNRDHLDQVLATFGLILFFELVRIIWVHRRAYGGGPRPFSCQIVLLPAYLLGPTAWQSSGWGCSSLSGSIL